MVWYVIGYVRALIGHPSFQINHVTLCFFNIHYVCCIHYVCSTFITFGE